VRVEEVGVTPSPIIETALGLTLERRDQEGSWRGFLRFYVAHSGVD